VGVQDCRFSSVLQKVIAAAKREQVERLLVENARPRPTHVLDLVPPTHADRHAFGLHGTAGLHEVECTGVFGFQRATRNL
jgi:hypothetical protein